MYFHATLSNKVFIKVIFYVVKTTYNLVGFGSFAGICGACSSTFSSSSCTKDINKQIIQLQFLPRHIRFNIYIIIIFKNIKIYIIQMSLITILYSLFIIKNKDTD